MIGAITDVASTIKTIEGWFPGSLSYRLNNPGNLTYAGQPGATPVTIGSHTWASFNTYDAGEQALLNQIQLDASRGLSIQQFVDKYAPASDNNNTTSYAQQIANVTGLSVNDPLSKAINGSGGNGGGIGYGLDTSTLDSGTVDSSNGNSNNLNVFGIDLSNISNVGIDPSTMVIVGLGLFGVLMFTR